MENSQEALQRIVSLLLTYQEGKGEAITLTALAGKVGLTEDQLQAYLKGEAETPAGLHLRLTAAFSITTTMIGFTKEEEVPDPPGPGEQSPANNRSSVKATVHLIRSLGSAKGINITEDEMAGKTGIPREQLQAYLNGSQNTPADLTGLLLAAYKDLLTAHRVEASKSSLQHTVVFIRNQGLAKGMDITLAAMAGKVNISREALLNYLKNGYDYEVVLADLSFQLHKAYEKLLKGINQVELREDINVIMASV